MENNLKVLFVVFCFHVFIINCEEIAEEDKCNSIHHYFREECGWTGISKWLCMARGCCYDNTFKKSIWCFRKDSSLQDISSVVPSKVETNYLKSCKQNPKKRKNCGWKGISQQVCEMRGCCYDNTIRNTYWCYKSDRIYLDLLTSKVLKCTAKCSGMQWSAVTDTTLQCKLNETCWSEEHSENVISCLQSCKTQESILEFIYNVSQCLFIDEEVAMETHDECDFQMSCWVQRHGHSAMQCYHRFNKDLQGVNFGDMVENETEKDVPLKTYAGQPAMEQNLEEHNQIMQYVLRIQPESESTRLSEEIMVEEVRIDV